MNISQVGINLIKSFEGCSLTAYKAVPTEKYYTIGWGRYSPDIKAGDKITQKQADLYFLEDIKKYVDGVNDLVTRNITQYQFDSLVSFSYNCGVGALRTSDLLKYVNAGNFKAASLEFAKWNKSGGVVLKGLVNRREAERQLFMKPMPVLNKEKIINYTIKKGETLSHIAVAYHTTISKIMKLNPQIKNQNLVYLNQKIKVPDNR